MAKEKDVTKTKAKKKETLAFEEDFATRKLEIVSPDELEKQEKKPVPVKKEKKERQSSGVGATIVVFILLVGIVAGAYYWYNEVYKKDSGKITQVVNEKLGYSYVNYQSKENNKLVFLNETYLIEYAADIAYKVADREGNVLFEDQMAFDEVYMDLNDNLYIITDDEAEEGNLLSLYKLENGKFVLVKDYHEAGYNFEKITYELNGKTYLFGISKNNYNFADTTKVNSITLLETEEEVTLPAGTKFGNLNSTDFVNYSDRYIVVNNNDKVGLYDLEDKKMVIDFNYESLKIINDDLLIAKKNSKNAIINLKLKKLVDYKYDYIDHKGEYIVVGIDNKIGLLDSNYNSILGLIIPCEYNMTNVSIDSYKVGSKYIITVTDVNMVDAYSTYIVNGKDKAESIKEEFFYRNDFSYTVSNDNKVYTIYDKDLNKKGTINLSDYDFVNKVIVTKVGNTLAMDGIYFDYETLKQVDTIKEYEVKEDNYSLKINDKGVVNILISGKSIGKYEYVYPNILFNKTQEGLFYYISDNSYTSIKKVNE